MAKKKKYHRNMTASERALREYWKITPYEQRRSAAEFYGARAKLKATKRDYSPEEISFIDTHMGKSRKQYESYYTAAKNLGYDINKEDLNNAQIWDSIEKDLSREYERLQKQGYKSTDIAHILANWYFGSE